MGKTKFYDLMKKYGYTQLRLSKESGVSQSNLSIYCNYKETLDKSSAVTRLRLSETFGMSLERFEKELDLEPASVVATNKQGGRYKVIKID